MAVVVSASDDFEGGATQVVSSSTVLARPYAILLMVDGNQVFRLPLSKDASVLGRAVETDIKLDFPDVSRKHCRVLRAGGGKYKLEDLGSSGGTFMQSGELAEGKITGEVAL